MASESLPRLRRYRGWLSRRGAATANSCEARPCEARPSGVLAPVVLLLAVVALLSAALLAAGPLGTDLSAQVARADFARRYGPLTPLDLRWYGGTVPQSYSWVSPGVMALLGVPLTGVLALVASALALAVLLRRGGAVRPRAAALLGVSAFAGNLVSGRVTYALGVAVGLWGLVALMGTPRPGRFPRRWLAAAGSVLAAATSPVVGLFLLLVAAALAASGVPRRRSGTRAMLRSTLVDGIVVAGAAAVPLLATALVGGQTGVMNMSRSDALHAVLASLAVALLVRVPVLRWGALGSAALVMAAFAVPSPVGLNATRLVTMFALPVVAGFARLPDRIPVGHLGTGWRTLPKGRRWPRGWGVPRGWCWFRGWRRRDGWYLPGGWRLLALVLLGLGWWQPPVLVTDLGDAGNPTASRGYFAPLLAELARRAPVGRVEVPPTRDYWEAAYVADVVPLARGWLRQTDIAENPVFFDGHLGPESYRAWLYSNGVSYVALPDAELSWIARDEAALIGRRPPYLHEVWRSDHWTLFAVAGEPSIVDGATLVAATGMTITLEAGHPGVILVRIRPSRWLRVSGPAPAQLSTAERWTTLLVAVPGRYTIMSGLAWR